MYNKRVHFIFTQIGEKITISRVLTDTPMRINDPSTNKNDIPQADRMATGVDIQKALDANKKK